MIRHAHHLAVHILGGGVNGNVIAQGLAHLLLTVCAWNKRHQNGDIWTLSITLHHFSGSSKHIKELVRPTYLNINIQVMRIKALGDWVKHFMQVNRLIGFPAFMQTFTIQHLLHGKVSQNLKNFFVGDVIEPITVVNNLGFFSIQNPKSLFLVGAGVFHDLVKRCQGSGFITRGRVTNQSGKGADDKVDFVPQFLKLRQFAQRHSMAKVKVRGSWVKTTINLERHTRTIGFDQAFAKLISHSVINLFVAIFSAPHQIINSLINVHCILHINPKSA